MSEAEATEPSAAAPKQDPEGFVLRGRPRPVIRFRRGLIVGLAGVIGTALVGLAWMALEPPSLRLASSDDQYLARGHIAEDGLAGAPSSYADVPRLGPPLPGDLGRAILERERQAAGAPPPGGGPGLAELEEQRREAERQRQASQAEAARTSAVLVRLSAAPSSDRTPTPVPPNFESIDQAPRPAASPATTAGQPRKLEFAMPRGGDETHGSLVGPPSPWTLSAGSVIPASLMTGLNSDLPGVVIAQVTENVSDSATGRTVLIPQGARLIGSYDSMVARGQKRILLVWDRILFPDGSSITLDKMPAADPRGYAGLEDRVDVHGWQLIRGIVLSTLMGVGTQLSLGGSESDLVRAVRESTQQNAAHAGDRITSRNLDVQPTLTVRPGWPVRAIVHKDLILKPWKG
jgi:type IV secretion system protein VirB10